MIGAKERTITFRVNGDEVIFDANSIPHYPNEQVGCFIIKLLENGIKNSKGSDLGDESFIEINDAVYDSPCIWDEEIDIYGKKWDVIEEKCIVEALCGKQLEIVEDVKERPLSGKCHV